MGKGIALGGWVVQPSGVGGMNKDTKGITKEIMTTNKAPTGNLVAVRLRLRGC